MRVLTFLIVLAGSALSIDVTDPSGRYVPDNSGAYVHDNSGDYVPDDSGRYVHQPGPDGPDYSGEATNQALTILSTGDFLNPNPPSVPRIYLPSQPGPPIRGPEPPILPPFRTPERPIVPPIGIIERPIVPPIRIIERPIVPPIRITERPILPPIRITERPIVPPIRITERPILPPIGIPGSPLSPPSRRPGSGGPSLFRPTFTPTLNDFAVTQSPIDDASSSRKPSITGGGPYIWHYESTGPHTVDVIDPFHKYRVHFAPH